MDFLLGRRVWDAVEGMERRVKGRGMRPGRACGELLEGLESRVLLSVTFGAQTTVGVGASPIAIVTNDFDGDGLTDMAVLNSSSNSISVLLNNGHGFVRTDYPTLGAAPSGIAMGDFDGINGMDLAVVNSVSDSVTVFLNNGG
ncbi:MAG TPA: VCBS repeat-containing protein, partial [Phycisphaerae bacterium]